MEVPPRREQTGRDSKKEGTPIKTAAHTFFADHTHTMPRGPALLTYSGEWESP